MFTDIMKYNCNNAIIQERSRTKYYEERLKSKLLLMICNNIMGRIYLEAEIFCGRRLVAHAKYYDCKRYSEDLTYCLIEKFRKNFAKAMIV